MRIIIAVILFVGFLSCSQKVTNPSSTRQKLEVVSPFQVIYAESSFKNDSIALKRLDNLSWNDSITLDSGYIILNHFSGKLSELSGDTSVSINSLANAISYDTTISSKVDLDFVYTSKGFINYKNPRNPIMHPAFIKYIYPYSELGRTYANKESLFLWWKPRDEDSSLKEYLIQVVNMYDEVQFSQTVKGYTVLLDLKKINFDKHGELLVIKLNEVNDIYHNARTIGININSKLKQVSPNEAKSPIEYLQVAVHLERNYNFDEAHKYYQLASESSSEEIFEVLFNYYKERVKEH